VQEAKNYPSGSLLKRNVVALTGSFCQQPHIFFLHLHGVKIPKMSCTILVFNINDIGNQSSLSIQEKNTTEISLLQKYTTKIEYFPTDT